jgi:hypothetical protein
MTVTEIAQALLDTLGTLPDVDRASMAEYTPASASTKIALLVVPFEQGGLMQFSGVGRYATTQAHRLVCEFWVKVNTGDIPLAMQRGREIALQAMYLLAANPTLGGTVSRLGSPLLGEPNTVARYDVLPRYEERNTIPFIVARVFVAVEVMEQATYP